MWQNKGGKSVGLLPGRESFGPLSLMAITPVFAILMWHTMANLNGDVTLLVAEMKKVSISSSSSSSSSSGRCLGDD